MEYLKKFYENFIKGADGQEKTKKQIQNLAVFLIIGIVMVLVSGVFTNKDTNIKKSDINKNSTNNTIVDSGYLDDYDAQLESKIKNILSQIQGVGKVAVAITYASSKEIVPAEDTKQNESSTNERDKEGGVRSTIQLDTDNRVIVGQQGEAVPVVLKTLPPQVKGVVVVADGARIDSVKVNISKAVSTALGISLSKIQVFPMAN